MTEDLGFTPTLRCGHCGNRAPLTIRARDSHVTTHEATTASMAVHSWEAGPVYEILACPACAEPLFAKYMYHEVFAEEGVEYQVLYPGDREQPEGLPDKIAKAYEAAQRVKHVEANAFGVLLRRVMELVCQDRGASGANLSRQLRELAERGEIPTKLANVANAIRNLGNVGAHAGLGELTTAEVSILDDLTRAVLEYVYRAPLLAQRAEERLRLLTGTAFPDPS